jgi:hypothetical protein
MKSPFFFTVALLVAACASSNRSTLSQAPSVPALGISAADLAAVSVPVETYIKASALRDPNLIRAAFHKDAKIISYDDEGFVSESVDEFAGVFNGVPATDEAQRKRSFEILTLTGTAAVARVTLDYPKAKYTDHMNLLRIGTEWKIVNKTYSAEDLTKPAPPANTQNNADRAAASIPLEQYIKANQLNDANLIRAAFHKDAQIIGNSEKGLRWLSLEEFAASYTGAPDADETLCKRSFELLAMTGNAGSARVVLDYPTYKFTDYMNLLRIGTEWKIVNKVFNFERKLTSQ